MESEPKHGFNGVENRREAAQSKGHSSMRYGDILLRVLSLVVTLIAATVMGFDKQTKTVPFTIAPTLPPLLITVAAKWSYSSAFVYFEIINAIACLYAAMSLVASLAGSRKKSLTLILAITLGDLIMVALLFSSIGAATDFGLLGFRGNSHVRWNKVCGVYGKFCHKGVVALIFSFLGSLYFLILVILSIVAMHKRSNK